MYFSRGIAGSRFYTDICNPSDLLADGVRDLEELRWEGREKIRERNEGERSR